MDNSRRCNFSILFINIRNFAMPMKSRNPVFFRFLIFNNIVNTPIFNIFNLYTFLSRFLLYILDTSNLLVYFFNIKYTSLALSVFFRFNIYISNRSDVPCVIISRIFCRRNFSLDYNQLFVNTFEYR